MRIHYCLLLIIFTFVSTSLVSATPGAIELDVLSLDPSLNCNRTFFQSPTKMKGIIFYVPQVIPGEGVEGSQIYDLKRSQEPGFYDLSLTLFFPAKDSQVMTRENASSISRARDEERCNLDRIKYHLNSQAKGSQFQIKDIRPIPLTQIELQIPGVASVGRLGGGEDASGVKRTSFLQYLGRSLTAQVKITEREKQLIERRLVTTGLIVNTRLQYNVKNQTGSVHAKVDLTDISTKISAHAQARGIKAIGAAEFRALVISVVNQQSVQVTTEGVVSEQSDRVLQMVLQKVFQTLELDQLIEKPNDGGKRETQKSESLLGKIQIEAAVERLKQAQSTEISFSTVSEPVEASTQVQLRFKVDKLNDANLVRVKLRAGYDDPSSGLELKRGQTMIVNPVSSTVDEITYENVKTTFLTLDEMIQLNLQGPFPDMINDSVQITNELFNGVLLAEGRWSANLGDLRIKSPHRMRWVRNKRIPNRRPIESFVYGSDFEKWKSIPIQLTFSILGDRHKFPIATLLEPSPFWTSRFDPKTGRLFLTAKQDLGSIRVRESMNGPSNLQYSDQPVVTDEVIQWKYGYFGSTEMTKRHVLAADKRAITKQRSIVISLTLED